MALCKSERRDLSWYELVIILVFGIATYHYGGTQTMASEIANRVSSCPRNESELEEASRRLNCTNPNEKNTKNRYHCLPVHGLTTLLEFCYNQTRPLVVNGTCMVYVQSKYILDGYNCATFDEGCPDDKYLSDKTYLFPYCTNIDPVRKCYVAEPACRINTNLSTDIPSTGTILLNGTSASSTTTAGKQTENENGGVPVSKWIPVVIVIITIGVLGLIVYIIYKRRKTHRPRRDSDQTQEEMSLLDEKIEAEIENLKINFILDELPKDSSKFPLIANKLKIPTEILFWTKENRKRFVDSMTVGQISVYSGRGMVVGCAKAGKTTLVKKLKGEKNLQTESTSGIEIHSHVFKLHTNESTNESTIIACNEQEKSKDGNGEGNTLEERPSQSSSTTFSEEDNFEGKSDEKIAFNSCEASVNEENLMMLSLLDFAGQSAYYACHHIFFSPRAFYILVVDMSKNLDDLATQACTETDLIYSNWTNADYIRYWLRSIHTHSSKTAPVILVASHSERIEEDPKRDGILSYYYEICSRLPQKLLGHIEKERVFSIEKNSNKNIKNLKRCIASTLKSQDQWGENVPIAWAKLESFLRKMREKKKICFILDLLKDIQKADDQLLKNREELNIALKFFNDIGVILFQMEVENVVILDVQWFVDAFKCIILDENHRDVKDKYNLTQFDDLTNSGLLYSKLLESLWGEGNFLQHKKSLVYYMKQLDMLAELSPEWWYVPCMNKQKYKDSILENCTVSSTLCFVFEFLPFVIFHRLIVACINKLKMALWQSQRKKCIYHNATILCCKNTTHRVLVGIHDIKGRKSEEYHYSIEIQAIVTNSDSRTLDSQFCSEIKQNIYQILHDLTRSSTMKEELFQIGYRCKIAPYSNHPENHIILEKDLSNEVDCSQCAKVHAVEVNSIIGFWKNDRLTGNDARQARIPFPESIDEDQHDSKTSISSSYNRVILLENEGSQKSIVQRDVRWPRLSFPMKKDEDDEDFLPQIQKDVEKSFVQRDVRWPRLSFPPSQNDLDDIDEESQKFIYYPPSEASVDTNSSSFTVFSGSSRSSLSEQPPHAESSSTDPVSVEELDDEEDPGNIPSLPTTPGDDLGKTPDREKFLRDTFENLSFTPESKERFKMSLDEEERKKEEAEETGGFNPRQSISTRFLSRSQLANNKNIARRQDNWSDRRRDVMARAVEETRKTLMAMGWNDQSPESEADPRHSPVQEVPEVRRSLEREDIPNRKYYP